MDQQTRETGVTRRTLLKGTAAGVAAAGASTSALAGTPRSDAEAAGTDGPAAGLEDPAIAGGPVQQTDGGTETDEETPAGDGGENGEETAATPIATGTLIAMLVLGLLSPVVFVLLVRRRMGNAP